jgi:nucleoside-diphosphate-sugar epimerase
MAPLRFLVFGAGFSGLAAIEAMKRRHPGAHIAGTTRDSEKAARLSAHGIDAHLFDGAAGEALKDAIGSATHILVSIAPGEAGDPVLAACADAIARADSLQWLGYYSTIGVYGDAGGEWIDETYPTQILNPRIGWRLEAEADWAALAGHQNVPLAILRLAGIYGPRRSAFDNLRNGTARRIIKPGQVFNRIHNADIGEITARAAEQRLSGIFNIADDEPAPPQDVIAHAAALLGVSPPPETGFATADLSPMARSFYAGNRRVRNVRIKAALNYNLGYGNYRDGLAAILAQGHGD